MRNSLEKLEIEVERLKALYALTETLFSQILERVHSSSAPDGPFGVEWKNTTVFVAANKHDLRNKLCEQFPRYLRETIFVRLISAAVDIFLADVLKEKFPTEKGKLLTANLDTFCKTYKDKLNIDLKSFRDWAKIEQMRDLRNELVHRLGWAKDAYRKKYSFPLSRASVGAQNRIHVHPNLWDLTEVIVSFAEWVYQTAMPSWPADRRTVSRDRERTSLRTIETLLFPESLPSAKKVNADSHAK